LAVSQGCSSFAIHYWFLRNLEDPLSSNQVFFFGGECTHLDQRRRQEYAVANSLLLKKSSIIWKKKFSWIFCHCFKNFSSVEYFVIVLQFEYIFKNVLSMNARSS
jgi:hypothetical protein